MASDAPPPDPPRLLWHSPCSSPHDSGEARAKHTPRQAGATGRRRRFSSVRRVERSVHGDGVAAVTGEVLWKQPHEEVNTGEHSCPPASDYDSSL